MTTKQAPQQLKSVPFSAVPIGGWFKPSVNENWHLKTTGRKAQYQLFGTRYEPSFSDVESVLVEERELSCHKRKKIN